MKYNMRYDVRRACEEDVPMMRFKSRMSTFFKVNMAAQTVAVAPLVVLANDGERLVLLLKWCAATAAVFMIVGLCEAYVCLREKEE